LGLSWARVKYWVTMTIVAGVIVVGAFGVFAWWNGQSDPIHVMSVSHAASRYDERPDKYEHRRHDGHGVRVLPLDYGTRCAGLASKCPEYFR
jgi:hypothetical protein